MVIKDIPFIVQMVYFCPSFDLLFKVFYSTHHHSLKKLTYVVSTGDLVACSPYGVVKLIFLSTW